MKRREEERKEKIHTLNETSVQRVPNKNDVEKLSKSCITFFLPPGSNNNNVFIGLGFKVVALLLHNFQIAGHGASFANRPDRKSMCLDFRRRIMFVVRR